ncbi:MULTISPECIES: hypothetical protein [Alphaproteobacteria]|uniref:hypothetical protein n=1 Tax=Alphaproteobacteria TaxID=28211 RepID=UPI00086F2372|nr:MULTISPECIES: hypothetical protein [Alphaproteobacteria]MBN9143716.1 hypothetical protein [Novosphingobium sp.]MBN9333800.1 hypothetical protein [Devosia sp.]ODU84330.1 MAG: hypothetical protein ABT10_02805 [Novosphingobium sp. SCN 63-17]OJX92870.1 MAG: hypothetical protein BGP00_23405 [Novosphingobium sp. 63-713]
MTEQTLTRIAADTMPEGNYAIVEALGHRTLVGRVAEVERFGTKMCQIEPLFADVMLGPVLLSGASLYQFTPCTPAQAYARRHKNEYGLPQAISDALPEEARPAPRLPDFITGNDEDDVRDEWGHP